MRDKLTPEGIRRRRVEGFLLIAAEELSGAAQFAGPLPRQAAYFLQQSVEKLFRAVLEVEGVPAGPTHNIMTLAQLLPDAHELRQHFIALDELSTASTRYRYPNDRGEVRSPEPERLKSLLADVQRPDGVVRAFISTRSR